MSVETRHTEKTILYSLLRAKTLADYEDATNQLMATMEPEDVELVQKRIAEIELKFNGT
jgi:hypothetical protein